MKCFSVFVIAIILLQAFAEVSSFANADNALENVNGDNNAAALHKVIHPHKINCNHECSRRCSKAFKRKRCKRACNTCCKKCHCVPPGTYGHKELCPCYARLKTHGNKPKCP